MRVLHTGEPLIQSAEFGSEPLVVDAQLVQDRGIEIADVDRILDDVVGVFIGHAVVVSALDATAGHPRGEASAVMVAS